MHFVPFIFYWLPFQNYLQTKTWNDIFYLYSPLPCQHLSQFVLCYFYSGDECKKGIKPSFSVLCFVDYFCPDRFCLRICCSWQVSLSLGSVSCMLVPYLKQMPPESMLWSCAKLYIIWNKWPRIFPSYSMQGYENSCLVCPFHNRKISLFIYRCSIFRGINMSSCIVLCIASCQPLIYIWFHVCAISYDDNNLPLMV
jgi:hypothetical protein